MKRRKANNGQARRERYSRAVLRQFRVGVLNLDWVGRPDEVTQYLIDLSNGKELRHGVNVAEAVCDIAHRWTVYIGVMCRDQNGVEYLKSDEFVTSGIHKADQLTPNIEQAYRALRDSCNPAHIVSSGWIANPCGVSLSEDQAAHIYDMAGAWQHVERSQAA